MISVHCKKCNRQMVITLTADGDTVYVCTCGYVRGIRKVVRCL